MIKLEGHKLHDISSSKKNHLIVRYLNQTKTNTCLWQLPYVNVLHKDQGDKKWSFISSDHLSPTNQQRLLRKPLIYDTEHKNTCRIQRIRILDIYNRYILFREQALLYNMSYMTALRRCQEISLSHAIWRRIIAIKNKA